MTAIITALGATALVGFSGLAIDTTVWHVNQRKMQGAVDQAAVAAGLAANVGENMTSQAKAVSASFGLVDGKNGVTVAVNNPPSQGTYKSDNSAVEVVISELQPQYLSRFFLSAPTVTVRAVALFGTGGGSGGNAHGPSGAMCIMSLDQSGSLAAGALGLSGTPTVTAPSCDVYNDSLNTDGTEATGGASLSARNIYLSGGYTTSGGGSITATGTTGAAGVLATYVAPMPDPYAGLSMPTYSGCDNSKYKLTGGKTATISPGVYCGGIDVEGGSTLTLSAGTYILDQGDFTVAGSSIVTGTGVTLIVTSSTGSKYGSVTINGGSTITISAPAAGASAGVPGVAIWVDKNAPTATAKFDGGSTQNINGAIYLPSQQADFAGGSSSGTSCSQLVALTIKFSGNAYFNHDCTGDFVIDPPATPILVQ